MDPGKYPAEDVAAIINLTIEVTSRGGYILLDTWPRLNKFPITTIGELKRTFARVDADPAERVAVLSGCHGESFAVEL